MAKLFFSFYDIVDKRIINVIETNKKQEITLVNKRIPVKIEEEPKVEEPKAEEPGDNDIYAEAKQEAEHIAKLNKILFDAHVAAGFDEMDALELTCAVIGSTNE